MFINTYHEVTKARKIINVSSSRLRGEDEN